jgi:hypothetical protein
VSAPYTLRAFQPGDEAACLRLLDEVFPGWPRTETSVTSIEHLQWKLGGPNSFAQTIAEADGMTVGMWIERIRLATVGGAERSVSQGFDAAVHPAYREQGVTKALRTWLPVERADLQIGWSRHPAIVRLRTEDGAGPIGKGVHALVHVGPVPPPDGLTGVTWVIEHQARFDGGADALWDEACGQFGFILERKRDFLNWRYCDRRGGDFVVRVAREEGRLLGYTVLRVLAGSGYVADALVLPGRLDVLQSLARDALLYLRERNVAAVEWWCATRHPYRSVLSQMGFVHKTRTVRFTYVAMGAEPHAIDSLQKPGIAVHLMPGDTDTV